MPVHLECSRRTPAADDPQRLRPTGCLSEPEDIWEPYSVAIGRNSLIHNPQISWEPVSLGFAVARFGSTAFNVTVIAVYCPTLQAELNAKNLSYKEFQDLVYRILSCNMLLTARDWSDRMGPTDKYTHHKLGRFGRDKH